MSPRKAAATLDQIADMLTAGATYQQVKARLRVSNETIARVRRDRRIDLPLERRPLHQLTDDEKAQALEQRYPQVAAMLRDAATIQEITAATGVTQHTITSVRIALRIPANPASRRPRTVAQTIQLHLSPCDDGHALWAGPTASNLPLLCADSRRYNARREIFRLHHGRAPQGRVHRTCEQPECLAGAHLADHPMRHPDEHPDEHLDAQYLAIFGPDAP